MEMQQSGDPRDVVAAVGRSWGWMLAFGILSVILGIMVMAWPDATVKVVAFLLGFELFIAGIYSLVRAFTPGGEGERVLLAVLGVLGILVGVLVLRNLFETVAILVLLLGLYWLIHGIIEFFVALFDRTPPGRWWVVFSGLLSFVAGVILLAWPAPTLLVIVWVIGLFLLIYGLMAIVAAFAARSMRGRGSGPTPAVA